MIIFALSTFYLYFLKTHITTLSKYRATMMINKTFQMENKNTLIKYSADEMCDNEPFVYKHIVVNGSVKPQVTISGKKFECSSGLSYLQKFGLLSHESLPEIPINSKNITFVIASDIKYYPSSRAVIATIKQHFGENARIIFYDLGDTLEHKGYADEMKGICNFEVRKFDWEILPQNVRHAKIFAWKVMIIAELFKELETFWYLDSSIFFESGNFLPFYDSININVLTPFQMSGNTGHSIRHATHKGMYKYIPLDISIPRKHDMLEANMMLIHRSEATRKIIKWSVLCAITRECIEPEGASLICPKENEETEEGICHRQDQSLYNILLANLEQQWLNEGRLMITHIMPNHPKNLKQRHQTRRMQATNEKINNCEGN